MKVRPMLSMQGIVLSFILAILIAGCQSSTPTESKDGTQKAPAQDGGKDKKEVKQDAKQDVKKDQPNLQAKNKEEPAKEQKPVVNAKKEAEAEKILQKLVKERGITDEQQQTFIDHLVKTAKAKMSHHEYNAAKTFLDQALQLDPTHAEARKLRELVGSFLGEPSAQIATLHNMYEDEVKVKIEEAKLEAQNHYKSGLASINEKDYDRAIHELESALEIIKWAPYQLGLDSLRKQAEVKIKEAQQSREKWLTIQREEKMKDAQKEAEKLESEEQAQRLTQIRVLLTRAMEFYTTQKYDKADAMVDQVLKLDPANKTAQKLQEDIRDASHAYISNRTLDQKMEEWKKFLEEIRQASIPMSELLVYPNKDFWHNVISRRKAKAELGSRITKDDKVDSPIVQKIKTKLQTLPITLNFSETPFRDVIRYIQTMAEMNIVVDPKVIQKFEGEGTKVNLHVNDLKLQDALNILLQFHNLLYMYKDDVLFITEKDSELAQGFPIPVLHDIRDLTGQIKDFPGPRIKLMSGKDGGGSVTGAKFEEEEAGGGAILTGEKLTELIKASIAPQSWEKGEYSIAETSGQLLVVHTEKTQEEIRSFLNDMRRFSGMMVAIESRFLQITDDFLEHIGVDWRGIGNDELTTNNLNDATDDGNIVMNALTKGSSDNAGGNSDNGGSGTSPSAGLFFRQSVKGRTNNTGTATSRGNIDTRIRTENIDDESVGNRLKTTGGMSFQLAMLDDTKLNMVLWMIKKTGRAELLMAPRLTAFNTQRSNLTVVQQQSYIKDFDVEVAQSAYIADPVIGTIQTGVVLDVRPTISNDRKYITMELRPTIASLVQFRDFETTLGASGKTVTFQIPELSLQSVETTVRIPDQGTLLLGGFKNYRNVDHKQDVPLLGNIPIISFFFSQRSKSDEKQDLIILIKAKIIDLEEEEEKAVGAQK